MASAESAGKSEVEGGPDGLDGLDQTGLGGHVGRPAGPAPLRNATPGPAPPAKTSRGAET